MALGHLLYKNDEVKDSKSYKKAQTTLLTSSPPAQACELVNMLGLDLAPFRNASSAKIAAVAREVASLLV